MRAVQLTAYANPVEGLNCVDIPEPKTPGSNEVLIGGLARVLYIQAPALERDMISLENAAKSIRKRPTPSRFASQPGTGNASDGVRDLTEVLRITIDKIS